MRRSMVITALAAIGGMHVASPAIHGTPYRVPRSSKVYKSNGKREVARRLRQQAKINARQQEK